MIAAWPRINIRGLSTPAGPRNTVVSSQDPSAVSFSKKVAFVQLVSWIRRVAAFCYWIAARRHIFLRNYVSYGGENVLHTPRRTPIIFVPVVPPRSPRSEWGRLAKWLWSDMWWRWLCRCLRADCSAMRCCRSCAWLADSFWRGMTDVAACRRNFWRGVAEVAAWRRIVLHRAAFVRQIFFWRKKADAAAWRRIVPQGVFVRGECDLVRRRWSRWCIRPDDPAEACFLQIQVWFIGCS